MADPTETRPDADANVIKDVASFSSQIQASLKANLLPDMQTVSDLSNEFRDNLVDASSSLNLKIVGDDKIEVMQQSLTASKKAAVSLAKQTRQFGTEMSLATDQASAQAVIDDERTRAQNAIRDIKDNISKLDKQINDDLVKAVQLEQSKLDLLPEGSSGYKAQEAALEAAKDSLKQANSQMATLNGQLVSADSFLNEFLVSQEAMVGNFATGAGAAQSMADYQNDLKDNITEVTRSSAEALRVNKQLREELELYGDSMKNFMENYGGMVDDVMGGFDKIGDSITGTLDQIPLIGGLLSKYASGPLGEAADIAKNAFGGALKESFKIMQDGGSVTDAIAGGMSSFVNGLSGLGGALSKLLSGPFLLITAIAGLLYLAFKRFVELDAQAAEFRESLGLMAEHNRHIEATAQQVSVELAHQGVLLENSYAAISAITEAFGTTHSVLKEDVAQVSLMGKALGVSEQNAAGSLQMFKQMGASSAENARHLQLMTAELASAAGVGADQVMADIADASDDTLLAMGGMPKQLAIAAVHMRKMGTSLDQMSSAAGKLLDFESSMTSEMKLSSMLGRHISLDKARQLAASGDMMGLQKEMMSLTKEMGGWDQMNRWQKEAAAEAMGMSVGEMGKMVQAEKEMEALANGTAEQKALAAEYQKALGKAENLTTEELAKQAEEKIKAQIQEKKMAQMQAEFNAMMVDLGEKLLPAIEAAMAILIPILKTIFEWIGYIMVPFEHIGIVIGWIHDGLAWVNKQLSGIFGLSKEGEESFSAVKAVIGGIIGYFVFFGFLLPKIMGLIGGLGSGITGVFGKIWDAITSATGKIGEMLKNVAGGVGDALKKVGSAIGDVATSIGKGIAGLAKGIGEGISAIFKGIGKGIQALVDSLKNLNAKSMLKAAAALLILAGAMWVSAKAFQEFAKVSWDSVWKGSVTLGAMTTALIAMSKALNKNTKSLMKGVGIMALLGFAIMPAAEAFKMFAGIDWDSVFYGVGALASFGLAAGLIGAFAGKIAIGAVVIALLGLSMIPLVWGFQQFTNTIEWSQVWIGLGAMTAFAVVAGLLGAAIKFIALGALAIALLGVALIPLAYGFQQFTDIEWNNVWIGLGAMTAFAAVAALLGVVAPLILYGSLAMGVLGLAMIPLAYGFQQLTSVDWANVWVAIGATAALGGVAAVLGFAAPLIILGSVAITILGLALIPLSAGLEALLPVVGGFVEHFGAFAESLSKITMEQVLTLGALGLTMAGFALLLPAVAAGAATVVIMAWSIGKLGDAADEAAPGINSLAEGLTPVIDKMLMISEASEKMRDASSVIREVGGAMASLGAGQAVQAAGGVASSIGGFVGGALDFASDSLFGTENVEKNKEGPIDKMIRLAESVGNLKGIEQTLQNVRTSVEGFTDLNVSGLTTLGQGIRSLVAELSLIDAASVSYLTFIGTGINNIMDAIGRVTEESVSPIKTLLYCIGDANVFSVAVAGFDSLTESIIRFGEALDNISLFKLAMLGLVSKTDEAEKELSKQPEVAKAAPKPQSSTVAPTPTTEVAQTTSPQSSTVAPTPTTEVAQQSQKMDETALAKKGYTYASFVEKIGGEDRLKKLQDTNNKLDELDQRLSSLFDKAVVKPNEMDPDTKIQFATKAEDQQYQKMMQESAALNKDKIDMERSMLKDSMRGLDTSRKAMAASSFDRKLKKSMSELDWAQEVGSAIQLEEWGQPLSESQSSTIAPTPKVAQTTPYAELSPMAQYKQNEQYAKSKNLSLSQQNLLGGVGGAEKVAELKALMQERDELKNLRSGFQQTGFEGSELSESDYDAMIITASQQFNNLFMEMQRNAMDGASSFTKNRMRSSGGMGSPHSLGRDMKALLDSVETTIESDSGTSNVQAGFELPSPATAPSVTETLATANQPAAQAPAATGGSEVDVSGVENNLVELIGLMKSGGIAVYLDSKKVSKGLAAAAEE